MHLALQKILYYLAERVLRKQQPIIIGVTGSMGKTSAKDAIYYVLRKQSSVRRTLENNNNEIGVPLTILGARSAGRNPFGWLYIFIKGLLWGWLKFPYPRVLILEMGADRPGDIAYLTKLAHPNIGIITLISETPAHLEKFRDVEQVAQEKLIMLNKLYTNDTAIVNLDEPYVEAALDKIKSKIITISTKREADIMAFDIDYARDPAQLTQPATVAGLRFKVRYKGSTVPVFIPGAVGIPVVYSALFALACGVARGLNLVDGITALQEYQGPNGRLRLLAGRVGSVIIDDTYNSSPAAAKEALHILHDMKTTGRRIAVLGIMAELGSFSKRSHLAIGKYIAQLEIDQLITIGQEGEWIGQAAIEAGYPAAALHHCATTAEAVAFSQTQLQPKDIMLVKGSQVARLEKVVAACLENPQLAKQVLVRQYGNWTKI